MPRELRSRLIDGPARQVGMRELAHQTGAVVSSLRDGERVIVTRHREPMAVILTPRDAIEALAVAGGLVEARDAEVGCRPWPAFGRGPRPVVVVRELADLVPRVPARDRELLRRTLAGWSAPAGAQGLFWTKSGRWFAAAAALSDGAVAITALERGRELERALLGEELWRRRALQDADRGLHGRLHGWTRPTRPRCAS